MHTQNTGKHVETQVATWKAEVHTLRERLQAAERARSDIVATLHSRLASVERKSVQVAETMAARIEDLSQRLASLSSAKPIVAETQMAHLEDEVRRLNEALVERERDDREAETGAKWARLAKVSASSAFKKAAQLSDELLMSNQQMSEARQKMELDRQRLTEQHVMHIQELQARVDAERTAIAAEAAARLESESLSREGSAAAAAERRMAEMSERCGAEVEAATFDSESARQEVLDLQQKFKQYQAQKNEELQSRIVRLIANGAQEEEEEADPRGTCQTRVLPGRNSSRYMPSSTAAMHAGGGKRRPKLATRPKATIADLAALGAATARLSPHKVPGCSRPARLAARPDPAQFPGRSRPLKGYRPFDHYQDIDGSNAEKGFRVEFDRLGGEAVTEAAEEWGVAAGAESAAAARREVLFERMNRQGSRSTVAKLKIRLKLILRQLEALREASVSAEEHARIQGDNATLREQLRVCKVESARRQRALAILQGLNVKGAGAGSNPTQEEQQEGSWAEPPAGGQNPKWGGLGRLKDKAGLQEGDSRPSYMHLGIEDPGDFEAVAGSARAAHAAILGIEDPGDFEAVARSARAAHAAIVKDLEAEQSCRAAAESKLKESKAGLERKNTIIRDLKQRMDEMEASLGRGIEGELRELLVTTEARAKAAAANCSRKDMILRELKEKLAVQQQEAASSQAPAGEEAERQARNLARARSEVLRKDSALRVAQDALAGKEKRLSEEVSKVQHLSSLKSKAISDSATLRQRAYSLSATLRAMLTLIQRLCTAAMAHAGSTSLSLGPAQDPPGPSPGPPAGQSPPGPPKSALSNDMIALMAGLSVQEVKDLLSHGDMDNQPEQQGQQLGHNSGLGKTQGSTAVAGGSSPSPLEPFAQECNTIMLLLETTLLFGVSQTQGGTRGGPAGSDAAWDPRHLELLISKVEALVGSAGSDAAWDPRHLELQVNKVEALVGAAERALSAPGGGPQHLLDPGGARKARAWAKCPTPGPKGALVPPILELHPFAPGSRMIRKGK
eukprot:gene1827-33246_t